jgi:hypothetical protein
MPPRKKPSSGDCPDPACAATFATIETELKNMTSRMEELKTYIKDEFAKMVQKQFDEQAKRFEEQSRRIAALEKFRDDIVKKIAYAMGAFAVIFFILQIIIQFLVKKS